MSAFIVGPKHIATIVDAALSKRGNVYDRGEFVLGVTPDKREELCAMLADENAASVNHRYNDKQEAARGFPFVPYRDGTDTLKVLKALACYEYQSCEHDGWNASKARALCKWLRERLINDLPGYDAAPGWSID